MSIAVTLAATATVIETLTDTFLSANAKTVTHNGLNQSTTLNSGSTPPATKVASFEVTMSSGAATIDLRDLTGTNGGPIDGNGLKLQVALFKSKSGNANSITITEGASNGYLLFGTSGSLILPNAGSWQLLFGNDGLADIDGTHKTIDIAGTGAQVLQCLLVLG